VYPKDKYYIENLLKEQSQHFINFCCIYETNFKGFIKDKDNTNNLIKTFDKFNTIQNLMKFDRLLENLIKFDYTVINLCNNAIEDFNMQTLKDYVADTNVIFIKLIYVDTIEFIVLLLKDDNRILRCLKLPLIKDLFDGSILKQVRYFNKQSCRRCKSNFNKITFNCSNCASKYCKSCCMYNKTSCYSCSYNLFNIIYHNAVRHKLEDLIVEIEPGSLI
jgi:hypothetical protein